MHTVFSAFAIISRKTAALDRGCGTRIVLTRHPVRCTVHGSSHNPSFFCLYSLAQRFVRRVLPAVVVDFITSDDIRRGPAQRSIGVHLHKCPPVRLSLMCKDRRRPTGWPASAPSGPRSVGPVRRLVRPGARQSRFAAWSRDADD